MTVNDPERINRVLTALKRRPNEPPGRVATVVDVAITLADDYAMAAPEHLRDQAAVRAAGWLLDSNPALASRSYGSESSGLTGTEHFRTGSALRASGGTALLARYVPRRAV